MPPSFEFLVTSRRGVVPKIGEVEAQRVEVLPVPAVVLDVPSAVTARRDRQAHMVERPRVALRKVEQGVMRGVELPTTRERALHRQGNPVTERHAQLIKMVG